jgi:hypothetical protein
MDAEQTRADAALYALWRLAHKRTEWVKVLGGHNTHRASYLEVYTTGGEYLGRLWHGDVRQVVQGLTAFEQEELTTATEASRYRRVWRNRGDVQVSAVLRDVALVLGKLVKEVARELPKQEEKVEA